MQIAKLNRDYLTLADSCELAPETEAQLNVVIDEKKSTQMILLNSGVAAGQREVRYSVLAPLKNCRALHPMVYFTPKDHSRGDCCGWSGKYLNAKLIHRRDHPRLKVLNRHSELNIVIQRCSCHQFWVGKFSGV